MPHATCCECGRPSTSRSAHYCAEHTHLGRERQKAATAEATRRRWTEWKRLGIDPTHGGEAARKRGATVAESNRAKPRKASREPRP